MWEEMKGRERTEELSVLILNVLFSGTQTNPNQSLWNDCILNMHTAVQLLVTMASHIGNRRIKAQSSNKGHVFIDPILYRLGACKMHQEDVRE